MSKKKLTNNILWASFGPDLSESVMKYAIYFAGVLDTGIDSFYVVPTTYDQDKSDSFTEVEKQLNDEWIELSSKENINKIKFLQKKIRNENIKTTTKIIHGVPCYEIIDYSREKSVGLIVMDRGFKLGGKCILQKTTQYVVNNSDIPVFTANDSSNFKPIKNILVPVYLNNINSVSFRYALNLSKKINGSKVTILNVYNKSLTPEVNEKKHGDAYFNLSKTVMKYNNINTAVIDKTNITEGIMDYINDNETDLVVLQTYLGDKKDVFQAEGSIAEKLLQITDCPLVTIRDENNQEEIREN